jgi:hypothetical protein
LALWWRNRKRAWVKFRWIEGGEVIRPQMTMNNKWRQ